MQKRSRKEKKLNPWAKEKSFTEEVRSKPATIISYNEVEFVIENSNETESKILPTVKYLCFPKFKDRVEV